LDDADYVEVIVEVDLDQVDRVEAWLHDRGLSSERMRLGVLAHGDARSVASAFVAPIGDRRAPRPLPIPAELTGTVHSVTVTPVPDLEA
jgi:hypothetical protein